MVSVWGTSSLLPKAAGWQPACFWPAVLSQPWAGCPVATAPTKDNSNSPNSFGVAYLKHFEAWLLFIQL